MNDETDHGDTSEENHKNFQQSDTTFYYETSNMTVRIKFCQQQSSKAWKWAATTWMMMLLLPLLLSDQEFSCLFPRITAHALSMTNSPSRSDRTNIVILGGTGRIGTAVAIHLLQRDPACHLTLVGRKTNERNKQSHIQALDDVADQVGLLDEDAKRRRLTLACVSNVWDKSCTELQSLIDSADCVIHAAGPYLGQTDPVPLELSIQSKNCQVYVDVSETLTFLDNSSMLSDEAKEAGLTALVAAGAFPGMSNVLAKEAAQALAPSSIQDVRFQYFTSGLGGSGDVNLYITNLGFGEPMVQLYLGYLRWFMALSGKSLGKVDFFLSQLSNHEGNELVRKRVGTKAIFAWPFPEAATVARNVGALGSSFAGMGTAPDIWNDMLSLLVRVVPRPWWKNQKFSKFMADFSKPFVMATDSMMKKMGTGETHAMRIDVTSVPPGIESDEGRKSASLIQAHDSFRICVGQSCAEFALDALTHPNPGVYLPEQFYDDPTDRSRIIGHLTTTPGTFCYTGPVITEDDVDLPSEWNKAIFAANAEEEKMSVERF
eukprot:scaffold8114_cov126-Cylindrotheca_fusiformis.AAC.8